MRVGVFMTIAAGVISMAFPSVAGAQRRGRDEIDAEVESLSESIEQRDGRIRELEDEIDGLEGRIEQLGGMIRQARAAGDAQAGPDRSPLPSSVVKPAEREDSPWPAPVEGHEPVQPGEHPRLLFRKSEIPQLRRRAQTPEGQAIVERLRFLLNEGDGKTLPKRYNPLREKPPADGSGPTADSPPGMYTISHPAGYGMLYVLTGEQLYADLGREAMDMALNNYRDRDRRYSFRDPYGVLRAGPSLGWIALGYDLCYNGWDEDYRRKIALEIQNYNEGSQTTLADLARGSKFMPASNHWGLQVGGGAMALLAIMNDPGVDQEKIERLLKDSEKAMIRNVTEGFGDRGWFREGDGTGVMASHIIYLPAIQAWRVAGGKDFASPRPNVRWTVLKFVMQTLAVDDKPVFPKRGAYPHNVWSRRGMSGPGTFCSGFGIVTEDERPALLWLYNRVSRKLDEQAGGPFETSSEYPHRAILSLVNWPLDIEERKPAEVLPKAVGDECGLYVFRNRWRDADDILITVQTRDTRGWHKARTEGRVWVWGLGEKDKWGKVKGEVEHFESVEDGSGILSIADGTCLAVDFSGASGAEAMLVLAGPGAPEQGAVEMGPRRVALKFVTDGPEPEVAVADDRIVVGDQEVRYRNGKLDLKVFGEE
ncbi:MAG: hypothetical protein ACLFVW_08460 [Phycisphaerae bacterium]